MSEKAQMALSPYHRAMLEGRHAARMGRGIEDNPYHPYWPSLSGAWMTGWNEAAKHRSEHNWREVT